MKKITNKVLIFTVAFFMMFAALAFTSCNNNDELLAKIVYQQEQLQRQQEQLQRQQEELDSLKYTTQTTTIDFVYHEFNSVFPLRPPLPTNLPPHAPVATILAMSAPFHFTNYIAQYEGEYGEYIDFLRENYDRYFFTGEDHRMLLRVVVVGTVRDRLGVLNVTLCGTVIVNLRSGFWSGIRRHVVIIELPGNLRSNEFRVSVITNYEWLR